MRLSLLCAMLLVAGLVGCNHSPEGGTPGTHSNFTLSLPTSTPVPKDIKQGDSHTFDAHVNRGSEFKKDIKLTVTKPEKIDVKLTKDVIKASEDTKFTITVSPAKDAALGEHSINVTGTPEGGGETSTGEFKVKVIQPK
jgi:uncharacterized membrane protein